MEDQAEPTQDDDAHFWVFGYGSLMWRPGFDYVEAVSARMGGVHRSPCIYSWVHRGTEGNPGIVLGLAEGGSCSGLAFKVREESRDEVMDYLRGRELVTNVYYETTRPAQLLLADTPVVNCVTFLVDKYHDQYAGNLSIDELVDIISRASGKSGPNDAYFLDTHRQLNDMGIVDETMEEIAARLKTMMAKPVSDPS